MSNSSKDAATKPAASGSSKDSSAAGGRIVHDSRGNAVWNWDKGGDPSSTATTSKMLRRLDVPDLRVEGEAQPEPESGSAPAAKKRPSGYGPGYNPYDRAAPVKPAPAPAAPAHSTLKKR